MKKRDEKGVSPIIATILMIGITVIAAGSVLLFVSGQDTAKKAPTSFLELEMEGGDYQLTHAGGDDLTTSELTVTVDDNDVSAEVQVREEELTVGENLNLSGIDPTISDGSTVRVIHGPSKSVLFDAEA